jgi:serine/threonine protein kinase
LRDSGTDYSNETPLPSFPTIDHDNDNDNDVMMTDITGPGVTLVGSQGEALKFAEFYTIEQKLRSGSYGTVFVTKHKNSGEEYAVKVIDRRYV